MERKPPCNDPHAASLKLLAAAVEHAPDGLIVVDHDGRVSVCNQRAMDLLELPPVAALSRPSIDELFRLSRCLTAGPVPGQAPDAGSPLELSSLGIPQLWRRTDGIVVAVTPTPFTGGTLYTCKDVTELHQVRSKLAECEREFAELTERFKDVIGTVMRDVNERNSRQAELWAAKTAAEAATLAKSEFLASMSHEVRTPLNGILGYTDLLLRDTALASSSRDQVMKIRTAGNALLSVVNDILDFSEIESGGVVIDCSEFSICALMESALEIVEPATLAKGLRLVWSIDPRIAPLLCGDEGRLRQIVLNLLNNAVKFTSEGAVGLAVTLLEAERGHQRVRIDVSDTGVGIAEADRGKLFQRFSQIDTSVRRKFGGTGLGLAISKQLVERMGGHISVDSVPRQGSLFSVELQLPIATQVLVQEVAQAERVPQDKRVLLVEDTEMNGEIAQAMIEAAGYAVDLVADGSAAIAAVKARRYDAILMDIQMPGMDGVTATRHIRRLDHHNAAAPIIAMTAHVIPREVERFIAAGMNDHLGKPFKREALCAKLAKWCSPEPAPGLVPHLLSPAPHTQL
jgi:signal transduction histidine kinase/ActR/RegA family two-component response regulator